MLSLPEAINNTISEITNLNGVGSKTATRYVLDILNWNSNELNNLILSLESLKSLNKCSDCGFYAESIKCQICESDNRKQNKTICIVENLSDCLAIEKSRIFSGTYHILGGVLNPLIGQGPTELRLDVLKERVTKESIKSIILAINPSVEGDATCSYIKNLLSEIDINVERIGFGMPMGGSLEFMDSLTITQALENRRIY
jgi:recombination protein RecR